MARLKEKYRKEAVPRLMEICGYKNVMQVPRLEKIVLNIGLGEAITNAKALEAAEADLVAICGQHPVTTRAKKSIAAFRLREGMPIGLKVTLRGQRMWDFFDKLVNAVLPRMHEFQGVSPDAFDGRGNYTLGLKEQILFPEIDYDKIDKVRGLEICIVTNAATDEDGRHLLELLGMPFAKDGA
ncbi:MAG TPA: 50S ribosomal protein L5 [Dehalococcoidales bacterium]|nr:MAG: 50S ribosomal protein L5 [Chloroflexi bacterium RBG_16_60_22]HJX12308.1 50S ribosomal protein L5 [Dehalococcoidales bacterium]